LLIKLFINDYHRVDYVDCWHNNEWLSQSGQAHSKWRNEMAGTVVVLGAKGRFGRAAVEAFVDAGWSVTALARSWAGSPPNPQVTKVEGDAFDRIALQRACMGAEIIVNAVNPPYANWRRDIPKLTKSVIAAAKATKATIMLPGNVYNYGEGMPEKLIETTPQAAKAGKGKLRTQMEAAYADAGRSGVRTIVLRGGDFIEGTNTGNWFDDQIAVNIGKGRVMYPGPLDRVHAWAYLPDMARAMAGLAAKHKDFGEFEAFGFSGYSLTGSELIHALSRAAGRELKIGQMNWAMIDILGLVLRSLREVAQMRYLWQVPHALDGTKLARHLPDFVPTPLDIALQQSLAGLRTAA
jgi:nucleoside-diphosphate-sugar epimerase